MWRISYKEVISLNLFRKSQAGCKENAVDTSKKPAHLLVDRAPSSSHEVDDSLDRLREIRTEAVKADVLEGFAEIDRGEVVEMTLDDLKREIERCQPNHSRQS